MKKLNYVSMYWMQEDGNAFDAWLYFQFSDIIWKSSLSSKSAREEIIPGKQVATRCFFDADVFEDDRVASRDTRETDCRIFQCYSWKKTVICARPLSILSNSYYLIDDDALAHISITSHSTVDCGNNKSRLWTLSAFYVLETFLRIK